MSAVVSIQAEKPSRIQSPSYPSISLKEAVLAAGKIEARYRSSAVDRLDAAKLLGYSGGTGPSNMALAALGAYGLIDRAAKGEIRITERARSILHPDNESEKKLGLRDAAFSPALYRDLRERFRDVFVPPEEGVVTYLNRQGFNPTAVRPAARAFLQTMAYLQELGVTESSGVDRATGDNAPRAGATAGTAAEDAREAAAQTETAQHTPPIAELRNGGIRLMDGERVVFVEEGGPDQYLKLIANGALDETLLEALETFIIRQKKRLTQPKPEPVH